MDREFAFPGISDQLFLPFTHHLPTPTDNGIFIHTQRFVRNDEILIDAHYLSESLTRRTGSQRVVETEKLLVGLLKGDAVCLILRGKGLLLHFLSLVHPDNTTALTLIKGTFDGVRHTADRGRFFIHRQTIYDNQKFLATFLQGIFAL